MAHAPRIASLILTTRNLILILGDQLSLKLSSLMAGDPAHDRVLMAELIDEASYVGHHKKKIAFIFSAMRHFAQELGDAGWTVDYITLDDDANKGSFDAQLADAIARHQPEQVLMTHSGEWRVAEMLGHLDITVLSDDRFIASPQEFAEWADGRKQLRMEYFYRDMRRKTGLLMDGDKPEGGQWNYDADNRKKADPDLFMPRPARFAHDAITSDVLALVASQFADNFGDLEPFDYAVTRTDAEAALAMFIDKALPAFGDYQDAMLTQQPFLYHAVIAQYLNIGLLDPLVTCQLVEKAYQTGHVPLNAAEGFIRQIIGWREYIRGIYWLKMPEYADSNYFDHHRDLPDFYWSGQTDMACLRAAIGQTKKYAYAHHIQRLMVTGNFAMLIGVEPRQIHEWYLAVYADAYEWVELPNTIGMSQFADGGLLASKPYAASGAYINRMSNYCGDCRYNVKDRTGNKACPFNALYWNFIARHREKFAKNPRMKFMISTYDKFGKDEQQAITDQAEAFCKKL